MQPACELSFDRTGDDTLLVRLSGSWTLGAKAPTSARTRFGFESEKSVWS